MNCHRGYFICSCKHFELNGFACRHILCVLTSCSGYKEPSHHDFSVCHWKEYHHYYSSQSGDALSEKFDYLRDNDVIGPYHDPELVAKDPVVEIIPDEFERGLKFCCINYKFCNVNYLAEFGGVYGCTNRQNTTTNLSQSFASNLTRMKLI